MNKEEYEMSLQRMFELISSKPAPNSSEEKELDILCEELEKNQQCFTEEDIKTEEDGHNSLLLKQKIPNE